jgi:hypothetical protein
MKEKATMTFYRVTTSIELEADDAKQAAMRAHSLMHDTAPTEFVVEDEKSVSEQITLTEEDAAEARALALEGKLFPSEPGT